jgi:transcription elongation factor
MSFRFRRRIRLLPGVSLNLRRRGASVSLGVRSAHVTVGRQTRTTVGLPGSGISYTSTLERRRAGRRRPGPSLFSYFVVGLVIWWLVAHYG